MKKFPVIFFVVMMFCFGGSLSINAYSQWRQASGINNSMYTISCFTKVGSTLIAGASVGILTSGTIYRSTDGGSNWSEVITGVSGLSGIMSIITKDNLVIAGTYEDGILISSNAGVNWTQVNIGNQFTGVFELGLSGNNLIARVNTGSGYYHSTNDGANWSSFAFSGGLVNCYLDAPSVFYAASSQGLYRSVNNGVNWVRAGNIGIPANPDTTKRLVDLILKGNNLFTSTSTPVSSVYTSSDGGDNWTQSNILFAQFNYVSSLAVSGSKIFGGVRSLANSTEYGIVMTTNDGASWSYVNTSIPASTSVHDIMIADNKIYAGTQGKGIWWADVNTLTSVSSQQSSLPGEFTLDQNYPNPFNPETVINYELQVTNYVSLKVYDAAGKIVSVLFDGKQNAGSYNIKFDGTGLPGGVYFYRLEAGSYKETKRMMLVK